MSESKGREEWAVAWGLGLVPFPARRPTWTVRTTFRSEPDRESVEHFYALEEACYHASLYCDDPDADTTVTAPDGTPVATWRRYYAPDGATPRCFCARCFCALADPPEVFVEVIPIVVEGSDVLVTCEECHTTLYAS